ncbi:MAG: bifunctional adenosylcobinamide kinase/adenosylcobinamide-phosphate guanylyltransferase [Betaproteobacteria bacterium]|nr:bifunctional adenosylcobinamide kinase/adenosylcobinamide-phosphate guanylyltransferase [Betaproteobacteria bacterium]
MTYAWAKSELILGGQKSGKSARAEQLAAAWLSASSDHEAMLIATALAGDNEMHARIERHRQQRRARVPAMQTLEEPKCLAQMLTEHSRTERMLVIDCITLWLTHLMMPVDTGQPVMSPEEVLLQTEILCLAIASAPGPVVLISNDIGSGVIPLGAEVRAFVDTQGLVNQRLGAACERLTWMVAGQALTVKGHQA